MHVPKSCGLSGVSSDWICAPAERTSVCPTPNPELLPSALCCGNCVPRVGMSE